jgi:hypothetical protein
MWRVKSGGQLIHMSRNFKTAYRMAKLFRGTLIYKP